MRKKRDPAILDHKELFLQLKNEEINIWEIFCYPVSKSISSLNKRPYSSIQLKLAYYDKTIRTFEINFKMNSESPRGFFLFYNCFEYRIQGFPKKSLKNVQRSQSVH